MGAAIGQGGSVTVGETTYTVSRWEMTFDADLPDVTDTGSSGWQALIPGIKKADITFTMFLNVTSLVAISSALEPGNSVTVTPLVASTTEGFVVPGYVKSIRLTNPAKDPVELEVTVSSSGAITLPTS